MREYKRHGDLYGHMKQTIIFKDITGSKNDPIDSSLTPSTIWTCQAAIDSFRMEEKTEGARETAFTGKVFTVRYKAELDDTTLVIEHRSTDYDIEAVDDLFGDMAFMQIKAVRRV